MKPFNKISLARKVLNLSIVQKSLLNCIASRLGKNEFCWASIDIIMKDTCIKKRNSVVSGLRYLQELNLISILPPSNGINSNRYSINFNTVKILINEQNKKNSAKEFIKKEKKNSIQNKYRERIRTEKEQKRGVTQGYLRSNLGLPEEYPRVTGGVTQGYSKEQLNKIKKKNKEEISLFLEPLRAKIKSESQKPKASPKEALEQMRNKLTAEGKIKN